MNRHHPHSPKTSKTNMISHKRRCSEEIKLRIKSLQALGCCLDGTTTTGVQTTPRRPKRSSCPNFKSPSSDKTTITPNSSNHKRSLLRTSIQLPITPCLEDSSSSKLIDTDRSRHSAVSFADMTDVCFIPNLDDDGVDYDTLFYKDVELADMRYEAFLEKNGIADMI